MADEVTGLMCCEAGVAGESSVAVPLSLPEATWSACVGWGCKVLVIAAAVS